MEVEEEISEKLYGEIIEVDERIKLKAHILTKSSE